MTMVCPLCNAMENVRDTCPVCFDEMLDGGCLTDYLGPYSPYTAQFAGEGYLAEDGYCVHLIYCPKCRYDARLAAQMKTI